SSARSYSPPSPSRCPRSAYPRWTPENRPVVDRAKPASGSAAPSTSVVPRSFVSEQAARVSVGDTATRGYPDMAAMLRAAFLGKSAMRYHGVDRSGRVSLAVQPGAPTPWPAGEHMRVMEQSIEQRGDGGGVAEQLPPVFDRTIRSN